MELDANNLIGGLEVTASGLSPKTNRHNHGKYSPMIKHNTQTYTHANARTHACRKDLRETHAHAANVWARKACSVARPPWRYASSLLLLLLLLLLHLSLSHSLCLSIWLCPCPCLFVFSTSWPSLLSNIFITNSTLPLFPFIVHIFFASFPFTPLHRQQQENQAKSLPFITFATIYLFIYLSIYLLLFMFLTTTTYYYHHL